MAVIRTIQAERNLATGAPPSTRIDDSVGRGLQALGGAVQNASDTMHAIEMRRLQSEMQMEEFATNQAFQRMQDDMSAEFADKQVNIDPSGKGFADTVSGIYNSRAEAFIQNIPEALRPKFSELLATSRNQWLDKAAAAEVDQRNNWYRTGVTERQQILQNQVFDDPAMFDVAKADAFRTIDSSGLPPVEKEALRKKTEEMFSLAVGEREVRDAEASPGTASGAATRLGVPAAGNDAVDVVVGKIIGVESGGNANAKNPNSSASGLGQFLDSTWLTTVKRYRPDIASGRSNSEILALKNDPQLGREMTKRYTQENASGLRSAGMPVTPGTLYLAHFAGIGGAKAVLRADDGAALSDVLGPAVIRANGFLSGKSAGWLKEWASNKMGGTSGIASSSGHAPADPRYASLTLTQRLSIYDNIQAAAQRGETAIRAQQKAVLDAQKGALQLGIQNGDVSSVQQILSSSLSDGDKATLLSALRARQGDDIKIAEAMEQFRAGTLTADPFSSDDRKKVDGLHDALSKAAAPEQLQAVTEDLIARTEIVPQKVHNSIRAGLESTVPSEVQEAAQQAARISQINPAVLARREGGTEIQKKADDFRHFVNNLGLSPEQAARRIAEMNDPEKRRDRKALEPAAKEFRKQIEGEDLGAMFDESWLPFSDPEVGFNEGQRLGIMAEYQQIAEEQFYLVNGNVELAKNRAREEMKRLYGVTEVSGRAVVMKHPPEKYWPKMPGSDPFGYARDQIVEDLATFIPDDDVATGWIPGVPTFPTPGGKEAAIQQAKRQRILDTLFIVSTPKTGAMISAGEMPAYFVGFLDANGNVQTIPGKEFVPDFAPVRAEVDRINGEQLDRARRDDAMYRRLQEAEPVVGSGRISSPGGVGVGGGRVVGSGRPVIGRPARQETPKSQLSDQRDQLFRDAQDNGLVGGN